MIQFFFINSKRFPVRTDLHIRCWHGSNVLLYSEQEHDYWEFFSKLHWSENVTLWFVYLSTLSLSARPSLSIKNLKTFWHTWSLILFSIGRFSIDSNAVVSYLTWELLSLMLLTVLIIFDTARLNLAFRGSFSLMRSFNF